MKPPFTRLNMVPITLVPSLKHFSKSSHAASLRAFSRLRTISPLLSSYLSMKTSILSPALSSNVRPPTVNSLVAMRPSDLSPTSIVTKLSSILTIVPFTTFPSHVDALHASSNNSAKLCLLFSSVIFTLSCNEDYKKTFLLLLSN